MSKLLDNQVDTQNENLKIEILGFMQALVEVVMKRKKQLPHKKLEDFIIRLYQKTGRSELRVTDSTLLIL